MLIKGAPAQSMKRVHKQKCDLKEEPDTKALSFFRITVKLVTLNGV